MNVFPEFNTSIPCPICRTFAQRPAVLVPFPGTEDGANMKAKQVHEACWKLVTEMAEAERDDPPVGLDTEIVGDYDGVVSISLHPYLNPGARVIAGRELGERARKTHGLDKLDKLPGMGVVVSVPEHVRCVNPSFFMGMFGPSIKALGERGFFKRYRFLAEEEGVYPFGECIHRVLGRPMMTEREGGQ